MTEVESKFIIMARIAVELGRLGGDCGIHVYSGDNGMVGASALFDSTFINTEDKTEQELLDWLEELQEKNNGKS